MGFNCGIVGLPNVGKSTLFNALTATAAAEAANYPFCTIDPNTGRVGVPDERLEKIAQILSSAKIIPTQLEFVDIAGLVRGASKGEGLGNEFLGHIRSTNAIIHLLRCFDDENITHVDGSVDPLRDLQTIETELLLADLQSIEKQAKSLEKKTKGGDQESKALQEAINAILPHLEEGIPVRSLILSNEQKHSIAQLHLITAKPILYVCNVNESEALKGNVYTQKVSDYAKKNNAQSLIISANIEAEVACLESKEDQEEFLNALGLKETGLNRVVREGYNLLNLLTFFTAGPKETRAWTIEKGSKAPQGAGVIHSDFERGFICAETISYEDFIYYNGEQNAKTAGKMRQEGKEYEIQDGDIIHFRFNV